MWKSCWASGYTEITAAGFRRPRICFATYAFAKPNHYSHKKRQASGKACRFCNRRPITKYLKYVEILLPANDAAGDFCPCVAGRLRSEIVGIAVDHYSPSDDLLHTEAVCPYRQIRPATALHQRRKIPRVARMSCSSRIIVAARLRKSLTATLLSLMNMKGKESGFAVLGKSRDLCHHQNTFALLIKPYLSGQARCVRPSPDMRHRTRAV